MSALVRRSAPAREEPSAIELLSGQILRNRFLPVPPPERMFIGDGGFLAVGVEFLKWFVELGDLTARERVLPAMSFWIAGRAPTAPQKGCIA